MTDRGAPGGGPYHSHRSSELAGLPTVSPPDLLAGQVVLITGSAGGIGAATSILCGRLDAAVVRCGRVRDRLDEWWEQLDDAGIAHPAVTASVRDPDEDAHLGRVLAARWRARVGPRPGGGTAMTGRGFG